MKQLARMCGKVRHPGIVYVDVGGKWYKGRPKCEPLEQAKVNSKRNFADTERPWADPKAQAIRKPRILSNTHSALTKYDAGCHRQAAWRSRTFVAGQLI